MLVELIERLTGRTYYIDPKCVRAVLAHETGDGYCYVVFVAGDRVSQIPTSGDPQEVVKILQTAGSEIPSP